MPGLLFASYSPPGAEWSDADHLTYWAACVERTTDPEADERASHAALARHHAAIVGALRAGRCARDADKALEQAVGDEHCPPVIQDKVRSLRDNAARDLEEALAPLFAAGLRARLGLLLRNGTDRMMYEWIRGRCAAMPPGLAVCERCSMVFEPLRKRHAWRCDWCHDSPHNDLPLRARDNDGGGVTITGIRGEVLHRDHACLGCGKVFTASRADASTCSAACRKRVQRGSAQWPACDTSERPAAAGQGPDPATLEQLATAVASYQDRLPEGLRRRPYSPDMLAAICAELPEPPQPQPRVRECRKCGRAGPWLSVCGPCGDPS